MLALKELLGSKLKFGLIALAIGLVVSLTLLMAAMSEGLITGMTGAASALDADVLVFQGDARLALERSLLGPDDLETIRRAPNVKEVYAVGHAAASVKTAGAGFDAQIFGLGDHFEQLPVAEGPGGRPGPGETIADLTAKDEGVALGDTVDLSPMDRELTVVGFTHDRRYVMAPTFYVDMTTWEDLYLASALTTASGSAGGGAGDAAAASSATVRADFAGSASVAAVALAAHVEGTVDRAAVDALARRLGPDFEVATPEEAAMAGNGMSVMVLAVNGIQVVSLVIGALVVGVFFYVTTINKTRQIAAIKALGATNAFMYRQLLLQVVLLVTAAAAVGLILALGAGRSMPSAMAFDPKVANWALSLGAVYLMALVGSLFSLRAILAVDPATALDQAEH